MSRVLTARPPAALLPRDERRADATPGTSAWTARYGEKHRFVRIQQFPLGMTPPERARVCLRWDHYVVQVWDPRERKNVALRVDGDLAEAVVAARNLERKLEAMDTTGLTTLHVSHEDLVHGFLTDLRRRSDSGAIRPATCDRYTSALAHYLAFCRQPDVHRRRPFIAGVDRQFALDFTAFLARRTVAGNGRGKPRRPMKGRKMVLSTVRAMYRWAADPHRGRLLPVGFTSPFLAPGTGPRQATRDLFGDPDITLAMAVNLIAACDRYQLALFAPMLLYGLRAAEPVYLFSEHLQAGWLRVPCLPELDHQTKGARDKRFPLVEPLGRLLNSIAQTPQGLPRQGLLYVRRSVGEGTERPPLLGAGLTELAAEYRQRCEHIGANARSCQEVREQLIRDAGGISYDLIQGEFSHLSRRLHWPAAATLKDLRHLFATSANNAGVPQQYIQYLLGHAPTSSPLASYLHLDQVDRHYRRVLEGELAPVVRAIDGRLRELIPQSAPAA